MSDFFQAKSATLPEGKERENQLIRQSKDPDLVVLVDEKPHHKERLQLEKFMKHVYGRDVEYKLIYCYKFKPTEKELTRNIEKFVLQNVPDLSEHIPRGSKVLTLGRALYAITKSTSLKVHHFYDIVWNKTWFFDPYTESWVFPVDAMYNFFRASDGKIFDTWKKYFLLHQIKQISTRKLPLPRRPKLNLVKVKDTSAFFQEHMSETEIAWDLETSGFNPWTSKIKCFTCSFDGKTGYYLRWEDIDTAELDEFLDGKFQIGANLKFDCRFLRLRGVENCTVHFDTLQAGHLLNEIRSNSLKSHSWLYTYHGGYEIDLELYKLKHPRLRDYSLISEDILLPYAVKDAIITYQVYKAQGKHLAEDPKLHHYFESITMPALRMFVDIEAEGTYINWDEVIKVEQELTEEREKIAREIFDHTGLRFNLESDAELGRVFRDDLKLPDLGEYRKDGGYKTSEDQLNEWSKRGYRVADLLLQYRKRNTLIRSFTGRHRDKTGYWEYHIPGLDRMFPVFMVQMAKSLRLRANSPNLQQVPHHGEFAPKIRRFFSTPNPEFGIGDVDYSGLQLRIVAALSGDENMKRAFTELGGDLHSFTGRSVYTPNISIEEFIQNKKTSPYAEYRQQGKRVNFSFLFGTAAQTFTNDVIRKEWTESQCWDFIEDKGLEVLEDRRTGEEDPFLTVGHYIRSMFFQAYPQLMPWIESCKQFAINNGYARCTHGARRLLPELLYIGKDDDPAHIANLRNISVNSPVQTFEITLILRAMVEIHEEFKNMRSRWMGTVHDAVSPYVHLEETERVKNLLIEVLTRDYPEYEGIPLEIEGDLAWPNDEENPTFWGYGEDWIG